MLHAFCTAEVKSFDDASMTVTHFISTERKDRSKDIMRAEGMIIEGWPTVLKQHGFDPDTGGEPIAKCTDIRIGVNAQGNKGIIATTRYYNGSHLTPPDNTGCRLYEKAKGEFMPYWSIGFGIKTSKPLPGGGRDVIEWFIYEYSQVGVPDNVDCKDFNPETDEHGMDLDFTIKAVGCVCQACGHKTKMGDNGKCPTKCPKCEGQMKPADTKKPKTTKEPEPQEHKSVIDPENTTTLEAPEDIIEHYTLGEVEGFQEVEIGLDEVKTVMYYGKGKVFILDKKNLEAVTDHFDSFISGFKGLTERVATRVPYDAIYVCFDAFLSELYRATSTKEVGKLVKELSTLLTQYGSEFVEAMLASESKDAFVAECKANRLETKSQPTPIEPAPGDKGDDTPPAKQEAPKVIKLLSHPAKPTIKIDTAQIGKLVMDAVKGEFDKVRGKVS